ncbi:MAG: hypothetical protein COB85_02405 [Bacteroidetes bacterium]|nr:MAG: hypothetical protein COB85_02405 [Bacteroidota bacterium]
MPTIPVDATDANGQQHQIDVDVEVDETDDAPQGIRRIWRGTHDSDLITDATIEIEEYPEGVINDITKSDNIVTSEDDIANIFRPTIQPAPPPEPEEE